MRTDAGFEAIEVVSEGPACSVWRARHDSRPGEFLVKRYHPDPNLMEAGPAKSLLVASEKRARLLEQLSAAGAKHWVRVHETAISPEQVLYVCDYHPVTFARLTEMSISLGAHSLHQLIGGVVAGLRELEQVAQRTHGSLKPSNILLTLGPRAQIRSVVLTDPHGPAGAGLDDRYELGRLICNTVLGGTEDPADIWPIPQSPEWEHLGPTGDDWRELCNRLLHPNGYYAPDELDKIASEVALLKPNLSRRRLLAVGMAAAAIVAIVGTVVYFARDTSEPMLATSKDASTLPASPEVVVVAPEVPASTEPSAPSVIPRPPEIARDEPTATPAATAPLAVPTTLVARELVAPPPSEETAPAVTELPPSTRLQHDEPTVVVAEPAIPSPSATAPSTTVAVVEALPPSPTTTEVALASSAPPVDSPVIEPSPAPIPLPLPLPEPPAPEPSAPAPFDPPAPPPPLLPSPEPVPAAPQPVPAPAKPILLTTLKDAANPNERYASVIFVCDASSAMKGATERLQKELLSAIDDLQPEQSFNILIFREDFAKDRPREYLDRKKMLRATSKAKESARTFVQTHTASAGSTSGKATDCFDVAFPQKPQVIYLVMGRALGGVEERTLGQQIRYLWRNLKIDTPVNVVAIFPPSLPDAEREKAHRSLRNIAKQGNGRFEVAK